jgi:hypothetical protein
LIGRRNLAPTSWVNLRGGCLESSEKGGIDPAGIPRDAVQYNCIHIFWILLGERVGDDGPDGKTDNDNLAPSAAADGAIADLLDQLVGCLNISLSLGLQEAIGECTVSVSCPLD